MELGAREKDSGVLCIYERDSMLYIFTKRASQLVTYWSRPLKIQTDSFLIWRNHSTFENNVEYLPREQCFIRHKPLAYDYKIEKAGHIRMFLSGRKTQKLRESSVKSYVIEYRARRERRERRERRDSTEAGISLEVSLNQKTQVRKRERLGELSI